MVKIQYTTNYVVISLISRIAVSNFDSQVKSEHEVDTLEFLQVKMINANALLSLVLG